MTPFVPHTQPPPCLSSRTAKAPATMLSTLLHVPGLPLLTISSPSSGNFRCHPTTFNGHPDTLSAALQTSPSGQRWSAATTWLTQSHRLPPLLFLGTSSLLLPRRSFSISCRVCRGISPMDVFHSSPLPRASFKQLSTSLTSGTETTAAGLATFLLNGHHSAFNELGYGMTRSKPPTLCGHD